jgi:hypothetical protein
LGQKNQFQSKHVSLSEVENLALLGGYVPPKGLFLVKWNMGNWQENETKTQCITKKGIEKR